MKKRLPIIIFVSIAILGVIPCIIAGVSSMNIWPWLTTDNDWLSFWGSYLGGISGGIVTIIVFLWTVEDGKFARNEEHRLQVIPVLDYEIVKVSCKKYLWPEEEKEKYRELFDEQLGTYEYALTIVLKVSNVGLGPAQQVILKKCKYKSRYKIFSEGKDLYLKTIPQNESRIIEVVLRPSDDYDEEIGYSIKPIAIFSFKDIFGNEYLNNFEIDVHYIFNVGEDEEDIWCGRILSIDPAKLVKRYKNDKKMDM